MAEGSNQNTDTAATSELHHSGQDEYYGDEDQVKDFPDAKHVASGGEDALNRFEDRLKRKMAEGSNQNTDTAATSELHHSGQDEYYGDEDQVKDFPDAKHVASGGEDALHRFEDRLKRKMAEDNETASATDRFEDRLMRKMAEGNKLHHKDQDESDASNEQGRIIPFNSAEFEYDSKPEIGTIEQIEDEDDDAPRPFNSAEFEDEVESKPEIDFGTESNGEDDDGPPPPLTFQRDSLTDVEEKKVAASHPHVATTADDDDVAQSNDNVAERSRGDPDDDVQQIIDDDENQSPGDEENLQQRVAAPENSAASDDENVDQVFPTAAERNPSLPVLEAYLVEEDTPPQDDTVYEATPLEPELPWWKQRRIKVFLVVIFSLITALAASLGYTFLRPPDTADENTVSTAPPPATVVEITALPSMSLSPSQSPSERNYACFADRGRLKSAVDRYVQLGCNEGAAFCPASIVEKYGWPIGSWCVDEVSDMSELFRDLRTFDEDISRWDVGQVTDMYQMFLAASSFNQDLSNWNTSAVATMRSMFFGASSFNGDISSWKTSAVTDMSLMFHEASSFNQEDLSRWDTSAVQTMEAMFYGASFNGDISSWNTSAVLKGLTN